MGKNNYIERPQSEQELLNVIGRYQAIINQHVKNQFLSKESLNIHLLGFDKSCEKLVKVIEGNLLKESLRA